MSEDEQAIRDAATGAEEHHLEESEEPGQGEDAGSGSDAAEEERSPWAE